MKAKAGFTRTIKEVKQDHEFIQFLTEMFTTDDDGTEHPEVIVFSLNFNKRVVVSFNSQKSWKESDGYILKCNQCGTFTVDLFCNHEADANRYCDGCNIRFTEIGESGEIEW